MSKNRFYFIFFLNLNNFRNHSFKKYVFLELSGLLLGYFKWSLIFNFYYYFIYLFWNVYTFIGSSGRRQPINVCTFKKKNSEYQD